MAEKQTNKKSTSKAKPKPKTTTKKNTTTKARPKPVANKKKAVKPFYQKIWFWATIGGVILATIIIGVTTYALTRPSYEKIYDQYTSKIDDATPKLIKEFNVKADKNKDGAEGLEEIYYDVDEKLREVYTDGKDEMDDLKEDKNSKADKKEYDKWSEKLEDDYFRDSSKIFKKYSNHPDYKKYDADDVLSQMEDVVSDINNQIEDVEGDAGKGIVSFVVNPDNPDEIQFTIDSVYGDFSDDDLKEVVKALNEELMIASYGFTNKPRFSYVLDGEDHPIAQSKTSPNNYEINFKR